MLARFSLRLLCWVLLAALCRPAMAQPVAEDTQEDYRKALQSIADGRKADAIELLERVIRKEAKHAGAWLDLALIRCALGQRDEAERLFVHIEQNFDPPPGITDLIAESRLTGCRQWQPLGQASFSVGRGMAQNVNQGTKANGTDLGLPVELPVLDEFRPTHDQFNAVTLDVARELTGNGIMGFAQIQGRRYDRLRDYDTASLFGGLEQAWQWGRQTVRGSALLGLVTLGGHLYQRQTQFQLRTALPWTLPYGLKTQVSANVNIQKYLTLQNFDAKTVELRSQLFYRNDSSYASAGIGYALDRADADRPGGDRSGWYSNLLVRHQLTRDLTGELGASRQTWNNDTEYSPGLIDIVRKQRTSALRTMLSYAVGRNHSLVLEGRFIRNSENIPLFQYNDRQVQLSWQWQSQ
ncbi:tetratricopeptide repeat protein [Pseudoduganella lutea]|uniref:Tetratricopeptide repeat protein n=2 Tax=Pseudoduganella lutea TaxID=321985 RepID=A0A4P6L8N5_9BURK|nr:tetratricopeptide repeat protein [Pseudoduganella lutea]